MKCPKCNFVSFEYLNSCKKCGVELASHKVEYAIDFPEASDLGVLTMIEAAPAAAVAAMPVALEEAGGEATDIEEAVPEIEEAEGAEPESGLDLSSLGESVEEAAAPAELGESAIDLQLPAGETEEAAEEIGGLDLSGLGGETEKIDTIGADETEPEAAATEEEAEAGGDISLDLEELEAAVEPDSEEASGEGISLDIESIKTEEGAGDEVGELEIAGEDARETSEKEAEVTEQTDELDMGDIAGIDLESGESETPDAEPEPVGDDDISLDDLELDLNLEDEELLGGESKEGKKDKKEEEDIGLDDLDLDDLKLDD